MSCLDVRKVAQISIILVSFRSTIVIIKVFALSRHEIEFGSMSRVQKEILALVNFFAIRRNESCLPCVLSLFPVYLSPTQ